MDFQQTDLHNLLYQNYLNYYSIPIQYYTILLATILHFHTNIANYILLTTTHVANTTMYYILLIIPISPIRIPLDNFHNPSNPLNTRYCGFCHEQDTLYAPAILLSRKFSEINYYIFVTIRTEKSRGI